MTEHDLGRTEAYDYALPESLIARYPAERRDESRLLVVDPGPASAPFRHLRFSGLPSLLAPGDLLVLNESRVIPVRLLGKKPTGAECEVLLIRPVPEGARQPEAAGGSAEPRRGDAKPGGNPADTRRDHADPVSPAGEPVSHRWEALVRPGSKLKPGRRVVISPELEILIEDGTANGGRIVRLETALGVEEALERFGRIPLPPYLGREEEALDRDRYQTVYAHTPGSVAAPTAGLHFTPALLDGIRAIGVETATVTLHVGPGTFRPVEAERIGEHAMHMERWRVPPETSLAVERTRVRGGKVWAVGTTVVRTLESAADESGVLHPGEGETRLFISPGYEFRVVDALITNFHLPRSTLLMLVSAFSGYERTRAAYRTAIDEGYRFYSYGDAMVVPRRG